MSRVEQIAAEIRRCRAAKEARPAFGEEEGGTLGLEDAYRVQQTIALEKVASGDPIVGYKLGLISPAKQQQMNVDEPIMGHLHRSMLFDPGEAIPRDRFIQPRVEPELALVFGRDVPSDASIEEIIGCIDYALLTVDILDSIYGGYRFQAGDVVADNASGGAIVLGSQPLPAEVLFEGEGSLRVSLDGGPWEEGAVSDLGEQPKALLAWAVQRAASFERGIKKGDLLPLGAPCAAVLVGDAKVLTAEGPRGSRLVASLV